MPDIDEHNSSDNGFLVRVKDGWDFLFEWCRTNIISNNKSDKLSIV
ncbi:hypothetical protein [Aliiglaciecola sp. LCG003]|nr:hypothetical protein [Aliiglaciecola sp. LCG003]WJG10697.1 hypothetical protein QR722_06550 [Aliiglaciecola sp. LCG003]